MDGAILIGVMAIILTTVIRIAIGTPADILKIELLTRTHVEAVLIPRVEQQIQEFTQEILEAPILLTRADLQTLTMPAQVAHTVAMV